MSFNNAQPAHIGVLGDKDVSQGLLALIVVISSLVTGLVVYLLSTKKRTLLMIDFECFSPPNKMMASAHDLIQGTLKNNCITPEIADFHSRVIKGAGIDDYSAFPDAIIRMPTHEDGFVKPSYQEGLDESKEVMFACTEALLQKTNTNPLDIGIVMVCCSCFSVMPSFAAYVVNRFKMGIDCLTYSLSGMGCSSSICCVDLAKHMMANMPPTLCLIVSSENITTQAYPGSDKSMQIVNCIFRVGGAATLLSTRPKDYGRANYELGTSLRIHLARDDDAFSCMGMKQDELGHSGTFLRKNVAEVAERGMALNMRLLAPKVLPYSELIKCFRNPKYVPDFGKAFEHFLIHTGGKAILDGLQKKLNLNDDQVNPSRDAYWKFGNTAVASTWYILARIESQGLIKKGDRLWQIGAGGAFKCSTATWKARKNIRAPHKCWE